MNRKFLIYIILFCFCALSQENEQLVVRGKVIDRNTNKPLSNVNLICQQYGAITNKKGVYKLVLNKNNSILKIIASHQGYKNDTTIITDIQNKTNIKVNIELNAIATSLAEIDLIIDNSRKQGITKT